MNLFRKIVVGMVGLCAQGNAAPVSLPNFTFRSVAAGKVPALPSDIKCSETSKSDKPTADLVCSEFNVKVGDTETMVTNYYTFQNRLTEMVVIFIKDDYDAISMSLRARYGKPCSATVDRMQNGFGATFMNHHTTWCFKTGKLTLNERALGAATISYKDKWSKPVNKPPLNF